MEKRMTNVWLVGGEHLVCSRPSEWRLANNGVWQENNSIARFYPGPQILKVEFEMVPAANNPRDTGPSGISADFSL